MSSKTIKLFDPPKSHNGPIEEITLRAPKYSDYMELGDPEIYIPLKDGPGGMFQTDFPVIARYVERLVKIDGDRGFLNQISLVDGMRIRDAVLGFFREAMMRTGAWTTRGTSSPEDSSLTTANPSQASAP